MILLTRVGVDTAYASHVLPSLLVMGVGLGLVFAPAMATATAGVARADAGVASAMVNTSQQVGGSIGTALLSTLASSPVSGWMSTRTPTPATLAEAGSSTLPPGPCSRTSGPGRRARLARPVPGSS